MHLKNLKENIKVYPSIHFFDTMKRLKVYLLFLLIFLTNCSTNKNVFNTEKSYVFLDFYDYGNDRVSDYAFIIQRNDVLNIINKEYYNKDINKADFSMVYNMREYSDTLYLKCPTENISKQELVNWLSVSDYIVIPLLKLHKIIVYHKKTKKLYSRYKVKKKKGIYGNAYLEGTLPNGSIFYHLQTAPGE